jgi:hypothetical protein
VASDHRFIATALKINTDLERVADLCAGIRQQVKADDVDGSVGGVVGRGPRARRDETGHEAP